MATSELLKALMGKEYAYSPTESLTGSLASGIGKSLPALVNPYGSSGSNLAAVLGGSLLAGLFGYSAKREAEQKNAEMMPVMMDILSAKEPAKITEILKTSPYGQRLSPLGISRLSALEEAQAKREAAALERQQALGDFATKEQIRDQFLRDRQSQYLAQKAAAKINAPLGIGVQLTNQMVNATGVANKAFSLADKIKELSGTPELIAAKNMNAYAEGLKLELSNLASILIKSRSGTAASDSERAVLEKMIKGDWSNIDPKSTANNLENFATTELEFNADAAESAMQNPKNLISALRTAAKERKPVSFGGTTLQQETGAQTPTAPVSQQGIDIQALMKKYPGVTITEVTK